MKVYESEGKIVYEYDCPSCNRHIQQRPVLNEAGSCDVASVVCPECHTSFAVQICVPDASVLPKNFSNLMDHLKLVGR